MEGNQQKTREALVALRDRFNNNVMAYQDRYFKFSGWHWHKKAKEAARWRDVFQELKEVCDAALALPPRNCDVGTPDEQGVRCLATMRHWRKAYQGDALITAIMKWAQGPYAVEV